MFILFVMLSAACAQLASENIQQVTACWILTVHENQSSKHLDHLLESIAAQTPNKDRQHNQWALQVYMVKKCFPLISMEDTKQIMHDFDTGAAPHLVYRDLVKEFSYPKYLKELKRPTEIKNEALDGTILTVVQALETEFMTGGAAHAVQSQETQPQYLYVVSILGVVGLGLLLVKLVVGVQPSKQKKQ